jgi:hypothetical protein
VRLIIATHHGLHNKYQNAEADRRPGLWLFNGARITITPVGASGQRQLSLIVWPSLKEVVYKSRQVEEPLVTRKDLEELIDGIEELKPYREFMKKRWIGMVMWWHSRSVEARRKYFLLRKIIVAGGVLIPVLTTLSMLSGWQEYATVTIAVVGGLVAGCVAWEGVANYGVSW